MSHSERRRRAAALAPAALALVGAILLSGCSHSSDWQQIDSLIRGYLSAFSARDATRMATYFDSSCHVSPPRLRQSFAALGEPISTRVDRLTISGLTDTTANVTATGTLTVGTRPFPLSGINGQSQFHVVRQDSGWKIANCPSSVTG